MPDTPQAVLALAFALFFSCGRAPAGEPTMRQVCERLNECKLVLKSQVDQCTRCFEHVPKEQIDLVRASTGGKLPDPETVTCTRAAELLSLTPIQACVAEHWNW